MSIERDQWFDDLVDFVEEHGGSMSQEQRVALWEISTHVPSRSTSGDLWYGRFSEETRNNYRLTKELRDLRSQLAQREGELEALRELATAFIEAYPDAVDDGSHDALVSANAARNALRAALSDNPESPALTDKEEGE